MFLIAKFDLHVIVTHSSLLENVDFLSFPKNRGDVNKYSRKHWLFENKAIHQNKNTSNMFRECIANALTRHRCATNK